MKNCLIPEVALGKTDINASKVRYLSLAQIRNNVQIRTLSLSASFFGLGWGWGAFLVFIFYWHRKSSDSKMLDSKAFFSVRWSLTNAARTSLACLQKLRHRKGLRKTQTRCLDQVDDVKLLESNKPIVHFLTKQSDGVRSLWTSISLWPIKTVNGPQLRNNA